MKISLVMIVKNEEKVLERCLSSVVKVVDEIVIVDTGSTDNTKEIAKEYGAKIYYYEWNNDFSQARNYGIGKSTGDYNLILDADEYVVGGTREDIVKLAGRGIIGKIIRINSFKSEDEISYSRDIISRIFPANLLYSGSIHEQVRSNLPRDIVELEVMHDGYLETDKSERNLKILYKSLEKTPDDHYLLYQLGHTLFVAGESHEAMRVYKKYYNISNANESYRSSAVVDIVKLSIELSEFEYGLEVVGAENKRYKDFADFQFMSAEFYRELVQSDIKKYITYLPNIEQCYKNCLDIGETIKYDSIEGTGSYLAAYNLGVWYEVTGMIDNAKVCYEIASEMGYDKAVERLNIITQ